MQNSRNFRGILSSVAIGVIVLAIEDLGRQLCSLHVAMKLLRPTFFAHMQQPNQTLIDLASIAASCGRICSRS